MKRVISAIKMLVLIAFSILCLLRTDLASKGVSAGLCRCLEVIIPSLYAMMIVSEMLIRSGIFSRSGNILIFLFSQAAGYPVGTKMLLSRYLAGEISHRQAELLSGICFGAGPAFITGCIAGRLFGSSRSGILILGSCLAANIILYALLTPFLKGSSTDKKKVCQKINISADDASESVISAGHSMCSICLTVISFAAAAEFMRFMGIIPAMAKALSYLSGRSTAVCGKLVSAVLDVTAAGELPSGDFTLLPAVSAIVSFGGFCVFTQLKAICRGNIRIFPVIMIRSAASLLTYIICRTVLPFVILSETTAAAAVGIHRSHSPVPSVMLVLMTCALFRQRDILYRKCSGSAQ